MYFVIVLFAMSMIGHGFTHLVAFAVAWRLVDLEERPYKTTVLFGRVNVGDFGIRAVGILWLIAALGFAVSSIGVLARASWYVDVTVLAAILSFVLCIIGLPDSRKGSLINLALVAWMLLAIGFGWLPWPYGR